MRKTYLLSILLILVNLTSFSQNYSLVWNDEFDSTAINSKKWNIDLGNGCNLGLCGWGNQEKENYRSENVTVANGLMKITAKKETFQTENYTSGRITTSGKGAWKYGKMVARVKMSKGQGLWHAFWMLPQDLVYGTWPKSGEIDIMEYFGHYPNMVQSTIHFGDPWPNNKYAYNQKTASDYSLDFHTYTLLWEENHITFYVDSNLIGEHTPASIAPYNWPFDQRFYFIINTAVGGNLTNNTINDAILPGFMEVDYVRVYAKLSEFDSAKVVGPVAICNKDTSYTFSTVKRKNWSFSWAVPDGATAAFSKGYDTVRVNFRNAVSGNVSLKITNDSNHLSATIKHPVLVSSCDTLRRAYGTMALIPGKIEMENFDNGGPLKSYYDVNTSNEGKEYRLEGVGIQKTTDSGGGYNIGWTEPGEWLNYTVKVMKKGSYDFFIRAATTVNKNSITLLLDKKIIADSIPLKNTGDYQVFYSNVKGGIALDSGIQVMRIKINGGGINLNFINVLPASLTNGLNQKENSGMAVYPNPVSNELKIVFNNSQPASVVVSTLLGSEIIRTNKYTSGDNMDLSQLPAGIYFVSIKTNEGLISRKIIKSY